MLLNCIDLALIHTCCKVIIDGGKVQCNKKNNSLKASELFKVTVELEGVEPSSKQGNHTLSTCLFQPSIFVHQQDLDHQLMPYPLKLHLPIEA